MTGHGTKKPTKRRGYAPTIVEERFTTAGGAEGVRTTVTKHGLVHVTESFTTDEISKDPRNMFGPPDDPDIVLLEVREAARQILRSAGLPTDEDFRRIGPKGGPYEPHPGGTPDGVRQIKWWVEIEERTEAICRERAAAELIRAISGVLRLGLDTKALLSVLGLMDTYHRFGLQAGGTLDAAILGHRTRAAQKRGPATKRERTAKLTEIVRRHAEAFWEDYPACRGNAAATAPSIFKLVNAALADEGMRTIAERTVLNYISRIGQSGG